MNLGKIWQKAKDLYGWDAGNLYFFKSCRELSRAKIDLLKEQIAKTTDENKLYKYSVRLKDEQREFDRFDYYVKTHGEEFDTNIGYRPNEKRK
jgi:hypothetical protein